MTKPNSGEVLKVGDFASWNSYWEYSNAVRRRNRYFWPREVRQFLKAVRLTSKKREFLIAKDQPFYRAQVGWDKEEREDGTPIGPNAYGPKRMKPVASFTTGGRANAAGIPVLYLAMEIETAIAEVRPWIGSPVSVSQFRTTRDLKALDLTQEFGKYRMPPFSAVDERFLQVDVAEREKFVWTNIDNAFSQPLSRTDDPAEYVPTQILTELFRNEGYEAICYRSHLGKNGYNVVIFELADAEPVDGSPYEVTMFKVEAKLAGNRWVRNQ